MITGRKKLDKLEWGESRIESLGDNQFFVHFTDYLEHKGKAYTHHCKQRLTISGSKIEKIEQMDDLDVQARLTTYYEGVGLK